MILADSLADRIIGLYAIGNSTREINYILKKQFCNHISAETISSIKHRVIPGMNLQTHSLALQILSDKS
jgi:transposase-like protein